MVREGFFPKRFWETSESDGAEANEDVSCPICINFVSDMSIPQVQTSVIRDPVQVDEYESDSESDTGEDDDEELSEFPITRHSITRSGRQIKASTRFDL